MTGLRLAIGALTLTLLGCATPGWPHRHRMPPPARESRVGAPARSAGPAPGSRPPAVSPSSSAAVRPPASPQGTEVARAISAASSLVGHRTVVIDGVDYGSGCAALIRAAFESAGHPLPDTVHDAAGLHAYADSHGALLDARRASPGDIIFLADRPGGPPVHVGLVTGKEPDGTVLVLHRLSRGVMRLHVNLAWPERPHDPTTGRLINDTLLIGTRPATTGSLVVGVADLLRRG
jgi:hypothetical protein